MHLEGFGIEDTHSCANSLRWGPDGWLYACQGSTVTGNVHRPGEEEVHHSLGQLIWRYHPEHKTYEVFAEGGGNAFGLEFDSAGRVYSGHNGGNTRGFHYVQGGYYQKGFGKHGPLSNPFSFGYFPWMKHHQVERFTHNFVIYEADSLPKKYQGQLFGVEPMQGQLVRCELMEHGSTYQTKDIDRPIKTDEVWFRPTDVKVGPDGAIYVADFHEQFISHRDHFAGRIDKEGGRVYRLAGKTDRPPSIDLAKLSSDQLLEKLDDSNKWVRQTALRLLYDRKDSSTLSKLDQILETRDDQLALEAFWAINAADGMTNARLETGLKHSNPQVQTWATRLLGDRYLSRKFGLPGETQVHQKLHEEDEDLVEFIRELAASSKHRQLVSQIVCTAKRLPATESLSITFAMMSGVMADQFADDPHLPLLTWWAIETHCGNHPELVIQSIAAKPDIWKSRIFRDLVVSRLMQRFAKSGRRDDLCFCTRLLELSPDKSNSRILVAGFEEAFEGRSVAGLPIELTAALSKAGGGSLMFRIRQGESDAIEQALKLMMDEKTDVAKRGAIIETFGQINQPQSVPKLAEILNQSKGEIQKKCLTALQSYAQPEIATTILKNLPAMNTEVTEVAQAVLSSRAVWAKQWLATIETGKAEKNVPLETVRKMTIHDDEQLQSLIQKLWPSLKGASSQQMQASLKRARELVNGSNEANVNLVNGKRVFRDLCGKCHQMYGEGSFIGPDLTTYNRNDIGNLLANVINPSAEIREGFENYKILTDDGRLLTGFIVDQDNQVMEIRGSDGQSVTVPKDEIEDMSVQEKSLMPDGLLTELTDQQVRDLFAFIRISQPLNVKN